MEKLGELPSSEMELVPACPACGSGETSTQFDAVDRMHYLPGRFGIVKCASCGLVRLSPRPTAEIISRFYPEESYYSYQGSGVDGTGGLGKRIRDRVRNIALDSFGYKAEPLTFFDKVMRPVVMKVLGSRVPYGWGRRFPKYVANGNALDIGCGNGTYLSLLKGVGWNVFGVELSEKAKHAAKEQYDIDIFCGDIANAPFAAESFDHIHLSHSLEHFFDPFTLLEKVRELLKPDGTLYIEVPNADSYNANAAGRYWFHWDAPRHLFGFTPQTLSAAVSNAGLEVAKMETLITELPDLEDLYRAEDAEGSMMADRSFSDRKMAVAHLPRRIRTRLAHLFDKQSGDFICCWARRGTVDGKRN